MSAPRTFREVMESTDPRDQIITRLVGSLSSHPAFSLMTANLIYELHGPNWEEWRRWQRNNPLPEMRWR